MKGQNRFILNVLAVYILELKETEPFIRYLTKWDYSFIGWASEASNVLLFRDNETEFSFVSVCDPKEGFYRSCPLNQVFHKVLTIISIFVRTSSIRSNVRAL